MTLFEYINGNIDRIRHDIKIGIITCTLLKHWQVYSRYEYYRRLGYTKTNCVFYVCNDFGLEQRWVYYIIKRMESKI